MARNLDLIARIDAWASAAPERVAHRGGERSLSYGELRRRSDALAARLARELGGDGSPVVVMAHKEPEQLIAFVGAIKAGSPYVPVDSALPQQRVERVVEIAGARVVLTPERVAELSQGDGMPPPRQPSSDDPYYIMFTSGSTGEPKGVLITLGNLTSFLDWLLAEQRTGEGQVFLNQVPYTFDVSVMDTYHALVTGGTIVSLTREHLTDPRRLYEALAESDVTIWVSTPSFAHLCLAEPSFDATMLPRVRKFLFCGEVLAPEVAAQLLDRFPGAEVWNTYGPTEATVATSSIRVDRALLERYSPLPIGYPMTDTRLLVMDQERRALPPGRRGELVIVGPNVSPGYLKRPDLTERAFFEIDGQRAYRTGDWGREEDGVFFCDGRIDNQVKLHGYRIELGDVESNLRALRRVRDAVVVPVVRRGAVDSLAAFVVLAERPPGSDFEVANLLRTELGERLPAYMLPRRFKLVESFPMTPNGKADRRKLAESLA